MAGYDVASKRAHLRVNSADALDPGYAVCFWLQSRVNIHNCEKPRRPRIRPWSPAGSVSY